MEDGREAPRLSSQGTGEATTLTRADEMSHPARVAGYRILDKIGEGGMGEVYRAEQERPIRRKVALKLIKPGTDTRQVIVRFESERQALAMMSHPNIAHVYEAGATEQGRPYFAMEYVQGIAITEYCDKHQLTTRERLELFVQVCAGVQHAHQKGIIHRDIKPSNVLVGFEDGRPIPKIIDFGVAKATERRLTEESLFTQMGVLIGTPEYMSPEQAEMTNLDIDTRTDVYSLGVVLYELLVGTLPFDSGELRQAGFDGFRRKIREEEPSKPSAKVNLRGGDSAELARRRRTDPAALTRELRGDLDWITMKAMEKDRTRRYGSASDLAQDILRHLKHEPVQAGPPGAGYRMRKFVRRHRVGVGAAAVFVSLLVGIAARERVQGRRIVQERDRAQQEAETAEQVIDFLRDLFAISDPGRARGEAITAREVLDRGAERIRTELHDQPLVQARLMQTIGTAYRELGLLEDARPLLEQAHNVRRQLRGEDHLETLRALEDLTWLYFRAHQHERARELAAELVETSRRVRGEEHPLTLRGSNLLGVIYMDTDRLDDAEELFASNLAIHRRVRGADHRDAVTALGNLCMVHARQRPTDETEAECTEAVERSNRVYGEDSPQTFFPMWSLAEVRRRLGRLEEAETLHAETLERRRRVLGSDNPVTMYSMQALAGVYRDQGRLDEAESLLKQTIEARERALGARNPATAESLHVLGIVLVRTGRLDEAEAHLKRAIEIRTDALGAENPSTAASLHALATVLVRKGRLDEAETLLRRAMEIRERALGAENRATLASLDGLIRVLAQSGRLDEAETLAVRQLEVWKRVEGPGSLEAFRSMNKLAEVYLLQDRLTEAESLFLECLDLLAAAPQMESSEGSSAAYNLACIAARREDNAAALQWLRRAVERGLASPWIREDPDLQALHGDPEFEELAAEVDRRTGTE